MKKALVSGISGMDGSYLADFLLEKGYEVYGIIRRVSTPNLTNIYHLLNDNKFHLIDGDSTDLPSLINAFKESMPDEAYNLAAMSHVGKSWNQPILSANVTAIGALNFFEAARQIKSDTKIYQAGSSEQFGNSKEFPQNENTPFHPVSPYAVSKLFAFQMAKVYRESYGMFISNGILFNHSSPRRGIEFVAQKIVDGAVRQVCGEHFVLELGNLESKRDESHALDMVKGMWLMLQQDKPDDYVLASGETHSVMEFVNEVYSVFGIDIIWTKDSKGFFIGYDIDGNILIRSVENYFRLSEVNLLLGDSTKARKELGWNPQYNFRNLIKDMVDSKLLDYKGGK
jgi:GDPmannose 4,6-dehydratase